MPVNPTQATILEGILRFNFEIIRECPPDIASYAFKSIFNDDSYAKYRSELERFDILSMVDQIRRIINHPCPQNRSESYPYVGQECGYIMFAIQERDIANRDEKGNNIVLKNGLVITKEMLVVDKTVNPNYKNSPPDALTVIGREPEGLLGLTAKGPITKDELIAHLKTQCDQQEREIDEKFTEVFNKIETVYQEIVDGLGNLEHRDAIQASLREFEAGSDNLKRAVLLKTSHVFREERDYQQREGESVTDYINRAGGCVCRKIKDNLLQYDQDEKALASISAQEKQISDQLRQAEEVSERIKERAFQTYWQDSKLLDSEKASQWHQLVASESNYTNQRFLIKSFKPAGGVLVAIRQFKQAEQKIEGLDTQRRTLRDTHLAIQSARDGRKDKVRLRIISQTWLKYLRQGKFEEANKLFQQNLGGKSQKGIDPHAIDEFGKNAVYYAIARNNYLLARNLVMQYQVVTTGAIPLVPEHRPDVQQALESVIPLDKANTWERVVENEVMRDLNSLFLRISSEGIKQLRQKYTTHGLGVVYDGARMSGVFDSAVDKHLDQLKKCFKDYVWGIRNFDFERLQEFFRLFDKNDVFLQLVDETFELAKFSLKNFLSNGVGNLQEIKARFEKIKKGGFFEEELDKFKPDLASQLRKKLVLQSDDIKSDNGAYKDIKATFDHVGASNEYDQILSQHHQSREKSLAVTPIPSPSNGSAAAPAHHDAKAPHNLPKSRLSDDLIRRIDVLIDAYKADDQSCMVGFRDRRRQKRLMWEELKIYIDTDANKGKSLEECVNDMIKKYPQAVKGVVSKDTWNLLREIKAYHKPEAGEVIDDQSQQRNTNRA